MSGYFHGRRGKRENKRLSKNWEKKWGEGAPLTVLFRSSILSRFSYCGGTRKRRSNAIITVFNNQQEHTHVENGGMTFNTRRWTWENTVLMYSGLNDTTRGTQVESNEHNENIMGTGNRKDQI